MSDAALRMMSDNAIRMSDAALELSRPEGYRSHSELERVEFSSEDWNEIKNRALEILKANSLDTPERHLAYVRKQLSLAAVGDVQ